MGKYVVAQNTERRAARGAKHTACVALALVPPNHDRAWCTGASLFIAELVTGKQPAVAAGLWRETADESRHGTLRQTALALEQNYRPTQLMFLPAALTGFLHGRQVPFEYKWRRMDS